jgi:hypothetical protein
MMTQVGAGAETPMASLPMVLKVQRKTQSKLWEFCLTRSPPDGVTHVDALLRDLKADIRSIAGVRTRMRELLTTLVWTAFRLFS